MFKKIRKEIILTLAMFPSAFAFAQSVGGNSGVRLESPTPFTEISQVLSQVLEHIVIPVATVLVTIMIVFYGTKLVMSQGNETEITKAKKMIFWALVGGFIILGATGIQKVISNTATELVR